MALSINAASAAVRAIGPWTGTPRWLGERIDWGLAMVCLWGDGDGRGVNDRAASA